MTHADLRGGLPGGYKKAFPPLAEVGATFPMRNELDALVRQMVDGGILYREALTQFKIVFIGVALRDNAGNKSKTARTLGMSRNTFIRTLTDLGIESGAPSSAKSSPKYGKLW